MLEKKLKLYRTSAINLDIKERFPTTEDGELPLEIGEFTYDAKRMGGAPTIQCTIMYQRCLDDEWTDYVCTEFRGERYYLKQTPSSSKDNKSAMWKHECEFISERRVLDNVYFFDIVKADEGGNKPVSNSTDFTFFGNIFEFATRLTESMKYAGVDYVVDAEKHRTELTDATVGKQVTFQDKFISEALQEIFNVYGYHYYFEGKTIYIGDSDDYKIGSDDNPLEYGGTKELLSIQKNNANYKPINRITSRGSDQNIPYYYPNPSNRGKFKPVINEWGNITVEIDNDYTFYEKINSWDKMIGIDGIVDSNIIRSTGLYMKKGVFENGLEDKMYDKEFNPNSSINPINFKDFATQAPLGLGQMGIIIKYTMAFDDYNETREIKVGTLKKLTFNVVASGGDINYPKDAKTLTCYGKLYRVKGDERTLMATIAGTDREEKYNASEIAVYEWYVMYNFEHIANLTSGTNTNIKFETYNGTPDIPEPAMYQKGIKTYVYKEDEKIDTIDTYNSYKENPYEKYGIKLSSPYVGLIGGIKITQEFIHFYQPQKNLQTSVYIKSENKERFYPAKNYPLTIRGTTAPKILNDNIGEYSLKEGNIWYIHNDNYKSDNGAYYQFENPYVANNPYEHIIDFEDIMPTIEGIENDEGLRIDMFSEFAYDKGDNNKETEDRKDKDESGELRREHPYFFGKLRKMPFNLFDHAIEGGEMTIAMTSGSLGSCKFVIHVGEEHQKNIVQVNSDGSLKRDDYGNVLCGRRIYVENEYKWKEQGEQKPQDVQNDTRTNEVWVALAKDVETFPSVMPYAPDGGLSSYRPSPSEKDSDGNDLNNGDTFVILNIHLPQAYIDKAEERLTKETIKYLAENNKEKFTFSIDFSKVYLAMNPNILNSLNENSSVYIKYNDKVYKQFISSYSYKMSSKDALPEIKVELSETLSTQQGALQQVINAVKSEVQYSIGASGGSGFRLGDLDRQYIRRDTQDTTTGVVTFMSGTKYGKGKEDGKTPAEMQIDDENNSTLTVDNLIVRNNDERVQELIERIVSLENKINELTNN